MRLKAWQVEEEYEGYATIVFAETRNRAKCYQKELEKRRTKHDC